MTKKITISDIIPKQKI